MEFDLAQRISDVSIISRMAKSIADEIRNPLTGIAGTLSILKDEVDLQNKQDKLQMIDDCISKIDNFIADLYLLSKPINPCFIKIDTAAFIKQVVEYHLRSSDAKYEFTDLQKDLYISADIVLLQQAVTNILDNAIDAIARKGEIQISVKIKSADAPDIVSIMIRDTGEGIEEKNFEKLFTPFYSTTHRGHGLGLVIALNYINFHNGKINIRSKKSKGTTVAIDIPLNTGGGQDGPR